MVDDELETLRLLNFYLIVNSDGERILDDFAGDQLQAALADHPRNMNDAADKLILEFQAERRDTETKTSTIVEL